MIKTIIIEDEQLAARKLERILKTFDDVEIIATLHSVEQSVAYFQNHEIPDLIFSDIVLGDGLSFDIFEKVEIPSFIIYTTAFDQYTLRAFKLNSIDYLLKPIDQEEVYVSLEKYKSYLAHQQQYKNINFKELLNAEKPKISRVISKIGQNLKIISIDEISFFYSENKIIYAQTKERAFPTDFTLEELENALDKTQFFRVNRQTIIQLKDIKNVRASAPYRVEMNAPKSREISISRERIKDFKNWIS